MSFLVTKICNTFSVTRPSPKKIIVAPTMITLSENEGDTENPILWMDSSSSSSSPKNSSSSSSSSS